MTCTRSAIKRLHSSTPILIATHQGAVKWASRKTPPERRTDRSTSESGSDIGGDIEVWTNGPLIRTRGPPLAAALRLFGGARGDNISTRRSLGEPAIVRQSRRSTQKARSSQSQEFWKHES